MPSIIQQLGQGFQGLRDAGVKSTAWVDRQLSSTVGAIAGDVITSIPSMSSEILNQKWPDNYEVYDCLVQIINPIDKSVIAQFNFDIMPENLDVPHKFRTQVIPTLARNFILDSTIEAPAQFTLKGNFGINHKLILSAGAIKTPEDALKTAKDTNSVINHFVTGYGICKRLEKIVKLSHSVDGATRTPYQTYLISRAFNFAMRVEFMQAVFKQTVQKNRIWQYELAFVKVEDVDRSEAGIQDKSLAERLKDKVLQELVSSNVTPIANGLFSYLVKYI